MKIKNKKSTTDVKVYILVLILTIVIAFAFNFYNKQAELKDEINSLQKDLENERDYNKLYDNTKKFIDLASNGEHLSMLSGKAKNEMESFLEEKGVNNHHHESLVENIELLNVFATKTEKDKGESYAMYRVYFENTNAPVEFQEIQTLSLHAKWEKVDSEYKVYDYKIHLLKDTLDEYIKEQIEKGSEENGES